MDCVNVHSTSPALRPAAPAPLSTTDPDNKQLLGELGLDDEEDEEEEDEPLELPKPVCVCACVCLKCVSVCA